MANEITFSGSLSAYKATAMSSAIGRSIASVLFTMTGTYTVEGTILVATSATVIPLAAVTAPHWSAFHNLDATNFVKIRNGASGADVPKLLAGEWAFFPWLDTAVPYAIADTAACLLEYLIISL